MEHIILSSSCRCHRLIQICKHPENGITFMTSVTQIKGAFVIEIGQSYSTKVFGKH